MDGYLIDTSALSALLDSKHSKHQAATQVFAAFDVASPQYISVIALAELLFGQELAGHSPSFQAVVDEAKKHGLLDVTRHTANEYAVLKAKVAKRYLDKLLKRERPRWIENWADKATGQKLQLDENDLWMCAQARERDLTLVTADQKIRRLEQADPALKLRVI